jgi:hypothetical protein
MPAGTWTLRIFTISGDLVQTIRSDDIQTNGKPQKENEADGQATWNLISRNGQDVVSGIYLFSVESKSGTQRGKFVIKPRYNRVQAFSEGLAAVTLIVNGKAMAGFIDRTGRMVIKPQFSEVRDFHEGLAAVWIENDDVPAFRTHTSDRVGEGPLGDLLQVGVDRENDRIPLDRRRSRRGRRLAALALRVSNDRRFSGRAAENRIERQLEAVDRLVVEIDVTEDALGSFRHRVFSRDRRE